MTTKAATHALGELREKFPELRAGVTNCRKIAGSAAWSQHSDGNALDIHHKDHGYSANTVHQAWLDQVAAFIRLYAEQLSVRTYLWRTRDHYDHIHIDFWPYVYATPSCAGGRDDYRFSNGRLVVGDPGPENGYHELPDADGIPVPTPTPMKGYRVDVVRNTIKQGARGDLAEIAQSLLARHGFAPAKTFNRNHVPDGVFGSGSDSATRAFQKAKGLSVDGVVGPKTWSALESL